MEAPSTAAINLRLALLGQPLVDADDLANDRTIAPLLARQREMSRRLSERLSPVDQRIPAHGLHPGQR